MKPSITFEWIVLVFISTVLIVIGFVLEKHVLVILSFPSTVLAFGSLVRPVRVPDLSVTRKLDSARILDGESARVEIRVGNTGSSECYLSVRSFAGAPPCALELITVRLCPGGEVVIIHNLELARGRRRLPPIELRIRDEVGFRVLARTEEAPAELEVWPRSEQLAVPSLDRAATSLLPKIGQSMTERSGSGTEWLGVRNYSPGDPLRRLNWRAWARSRQLFTNDYSFERSLDVWIVLDARSRSYPSSPNPRLFEDSVSACATLAREITVQGHRVALYIYGGVIDDFVSLGTGPRHIERIMARLTSVSLVNRVAFSSLSKFPTQLVRPHQHLYLVSPLSRDDAQLIERLVVAGYRLTLVSPDPVGFREPSTPDDPTAQAALRIARLERAAELRSLTRSGCTVVDWKLGDSLMVAFRAAVERRTQWVR